MAENIKKFLKPQGITQEPTPQFFNLSDKADEKKLVKLLEHSTHTQIIDTYESQLLDYFVLENPPLYLNPPERDKQFEQYKKEHYNNKEPHQAGFWVHLPWRHTLLHILEDDAYQTVRTGRNRNLITPEEQKKYYDGVIGIAGQSVGNSCTLSIVLTGGGKHMRIADPDTLELTNLNRIRASIADITSLKVHMTARQICELDPYAELDLFTDGITEENIEKFFDGPPKLDVIIDEIDSLDLKIRIRQEAKKRGIPVVMAADNGDSGVLDVERHDLEDDIELFHGRAGKDIADKVLNQKLPPPLIGKIIGEDLIGFDIHEERMLDSLLEIGSSIPTWPQLGTAATINGALVATTVRKILTGQPVINERAIFSAPELLVPRYNDPEVIEERTQKIEEFTKEFNQRMKKFSKPKKE